MACQGSDRSSPGRWTCSNYARLRMHLHLLQAHSFHQILKGVYNPYTLQIRQQALGINLDKKPNRKIRLCLVRQEFSSHRCPLISLYHPARLLHATHFTVTSDLWLCLNTSIWWMRSSQLRSEGFLPLSHIEEATVKGYGPKSQLYLLLLPHDQCHLTDFCFVLR